MKSSVPKDARPGRTLVKKGWFSMRYQITSDSTCDLSPELLQRYNIRLLPLYVNMDGKTLRDGVDVRPDDIYAHVSAGGGLPKTAAVNLADYVRMFTELSAQNDFVIHICISLDFSCCYQNAKLAAKLTGYKIDIRPESGFFEVLESKQDAVKEEETAEEAE